jgi:phosphohistidine phosphatase
MKTMKLYFFRHGEAEALVSGITDHDRKLTAKGLERTKTAAKALVALNVRPTYIYSSPRIRAHQTAEILAKAFGKDVEIREEVNFDFDLLAIGKLIAGLSENQDVLFVGHEPSLSQVVGQLTGGNVMMKKGGLARVDVVLPTSPLRGQLAWLIPPKVFDVLDA